MHLLHPLLASLAALTVHVGPSLTHRLHIDRLRHGETPVRTVALLRVIEMGLIVEFFLVSKAAPPSCQHLIVSLTGRSLEGGAFQVGRGLVLEIGLINVLISKLLLSGSSSLFREGNFLGDARGVLCGWHLVFRISVRVLQIGIGVHLLSESL